MTNQITTEATTEAEKSLVAMALRDGAVFEEACLPPEHFIDPRLSYVWRAIGNLIERSQPVDEITVGDKLTQEGLIGAVGGFSFLSELGTFAPGLTSNGPYYASMVRNGWLKRQLFKLVGDLKGLSDRGYTGTDLLEKVTATVDDLYNNSGRRLPNMAETCRREVETIVSEIAAGNKDEYGLPAGLGLDRLVPGGIPRDKVSILFGETGNFKTTTKDNLVDNIAKTGVVLNFSLEDSGELTRQCMLARLTGIPYSKIATRDLLDAEVKKLEKATRQHEALLANVITIADFPPSMAEIVRIARQYKRTHGVVAVFVDYIQLLDYGNQQERIALGEAVKMAQRAAHRDKIAYILLSQVNRAKMVNRGDFRPTLDDLFGSSMLQHGCKLAIGVYRPWKYDPCPTDGDYSSLITENPRGGEIYRSICELHVVKNRLGVTDEHVTVRVDLPTGKMVSL